MASGSLTIGDIDKNFGGGTNWTTNTAGLMLECLDNTEIAIHDGYTRLVSLIHYVGGSSSFVVNYGRDMGNGSPSHWFIGNFNVAFGGTTRLQVGNENINTGGATLRYMARDEDPSSTRTTSSFNTSLKVTGSTWTTGVFITTSDARIKKDFVDLDDNESLNIVNQLKPRKYKYKDPIAKGT
eukprot:424725-Hanusia_phi.AAC.1